MRVLAGARLCGFKLKIAREPVTGHGLGEVE